MKGNQATAAIPVTINLSFIGLRGFFVGHVQKKGAFAGENLKKQANFCGWRIANYNT